ncbi:hypothetical protein RHGRI_035411 [Rhododendron griersonianum]|uniref:Fe2OG dioxygenase domain-containing protein n=1 Tax=Rhododendron griersonianum TaxID=479676 RepID=A0AAV6I4G0_9ERIC|nr:hypothetical protein RHGRI_035411 [Rhododendron griersonianum]
MNRGRTRNDGGRYSTPRGRGRGRGRSPSRSAASYSAHHHGPAGPDGPSSNVSSGNNYGGSHLEWRPIVPAGSSISKQFDCRSTSKSPCRENPSCPSTKDEVSSDLGKLKLVESSPEAVTPKMEQVYCKSISVVSSASAFEKGFPSIDFRDKDLSIRRTQKGKIPGAEVESDSSLRVDGSPALDTVHLGNEHSPHKKAVDNGSSDISGSLAVRVPYDICLVRAEKSVTLKAPLLEQNRAKRNEAKRSIEGTCINVLRPGMILLKSHIPIKDQIEIVNKCRDLGLSSGGFYEPGYREGGKLQLKMMCLGKNWDPERSEYGDQRPSDGAKPPLIPSEFCQLVKGAIQASHSFLREHHKVPIVEHVLPTVSPTICIVNFYSESGRLGLHQDKDESRESLNKGLPVVSLSIGESAEFLYNDHRDTESAKKVKLESGDVLIFGGKSRHIFHGVTAIIPRTAPMTLLDETHMRPGRLNLTFREY